MPFLDTFRHHFLSFELQVNKPDARIYRMVLQRLPASPEECLFIDDREENIQGAAGLGFFTIQADNTAGIRQKLVDFF